jgi:hypothetical protein
MVAVSGKMKRNPVADVNTAKRADRKADIAEREVDGMVAMLYGVAR